MIRILIAWMLVAWSSGVLAEEIAPPEELLEQASTLFEQGVDLSERDSQGARDLFEQAMVLYEAIVEHHGIRNADLLVNLGNAAMLAGDTGRAVLAYRRAHRLRPDDARIRRSLAFARSRVGVDLAASPEQRLHHAMLAWRGVIPRSFMALASLVGYLLLWALAIARLFGRAPWSRSLLVPSLLLAALPLGLLAYEQQAIASLHEGVIVTPTPALNGPSEGVYEATFDRDLPAGMEVTLGERREGWVRVRLIDGRETWVRERAVREI